MSPPPKISRRGITIGGIVAIAGAIVAGGIFEGPRLLKRRAKGQYADLVNQLDNPETAARVGKAVEMLAPDGVTIADEAARDLKARLAKQPFSTLVSNDTATMATIVEAGGWVIPLALAEVCVLAEQSI